MSPADPPAARPWALLDSTADPPRESGIGAFFGGVVALGAVAAADGGGRVGALRSGLRCVPADVTAVVYLDEAPHARTGAVVTALLDRLGEGDDAVVAALPVTDALKRVEGDRVVSSVDRHGLYGVRTPQVLRRSVFAGVLETPPDLPAGPVDPVVLLLASGRRVRILPVEPAGGVGPR